MRAAALVAFLTVACNNSLAFPPSSVPGVNEMLDQQQYDQARPLLKAQIAKNPYDGSLWRLLNAAEHGAKNYDAAIEAAQRAYDLGFNPSGQLYNMACEHALAGRADQAIAFLGRALNEGFAESETIETDSDLDSLRGDPRFIALTGLNPPAEPDRAKRWAYDIDFLARRMEQMHFRLYNKVPKETLLAEFAALKKAAASGLSEDRLRARLQRAIALVGDGHTTVATLAKGETDVRRVRIHARMFADGCYIIGTPTEHKDLLGARVDGVGSFTLEEANALIRPYCAVDNPMGYLDDVARRIFDPAILHEIGAAEGDGATYSLTLPDGTKKRATLQSETFKLADLGSSPMFRKGYVYANDASDRPLYQRGLETPLTIEHLPSLDAVYFGFHAVSGNPNQSFQDFTAQLENRLKDTNSSRLIIDMRLNGGGNTGLVQPLVKFLVRNETINRHGHLFVIIGRRTFSAAQNTVNIIENMTDATFVGEPTGSRPIFIGESTYIVLPYSGVRVYCSSRSWQVLSSTDKRIWVQPQIAADLSFADFAANRDRAMDAIAEAIKKQTKQ